MAAEGGVRLTDIAPIELTNEFGVDPLRYYLLRETALGNDGDFSHEGILARYNTDLANNLGNLVARVTTVVATKCDGVGPDARGATHRCATPRRARDRRDRRGVERLRPPERARGDVGAHRRDERLPRTARAVEDGAGRRPQRRHG